LDALVNTLRILVDYENCARHFGAIEGFLHEAEGYALMTLAARGPGNGAIVELGSFMGRSTCWLAHGTKSAFREKVTAVDHFKGSPEHQPGEVFECATLKEEGSTYPRFRANVEAAGLADYVEPIVASSEEAAASWHGPIRLLFIDGDHSYEATKRDFEVWSPFVVPGGIVAFHDVGNAPGVTQFYRELVDAPDGHRQLFSLVSLGVTTEEE
jgi:MMP 1-O-methyltransferase